MRTSPVVTRSTRRSRALGAALFTLLCASPAVAADKYQIDTAHTGLYFKINHLGYSNTYGRFNDVGGSFVVDQNAPEKSSVELVVKADSIDTNDQKRDKHLRSPDFFNTKQNPTITFKSTSVKKLSDDEFEITGDLTLNGVTKPHTLTMKKLGEGKDPWGNYRIGFDTVTTIKRSDFNMNYMADKVGDEVTLMFSTEGVRS